MRHLLLVLLATAGMDATAQERPAATAPSVAAPAPATSDAPGPAAVRAGDRGVFRLRGGGTIAGIVVESGPEADVVELASGERLVLAAGSIEGRVGDLPPSGLAADPPRQPGVVRVFLKDGRTVQGQILSRDEGGIRVRTAGGEELAFGAGELRDVLVLDRLRADRGGPADPARGHYVTLPSALRLRGDELRVGASVAEPVSVAIGVTDWLELSAAGSAPLFDRGESSPRGGAFGAAGNLELRRWLRMGGGVRVFTGGEGTTAVLHAEVTAGTPAVSATLYAGPPVPGAGRLGSFEEVVVGLAGVGRLGRNVAAVAEAWVTPRGDAPEAAGAIALRVLGARLSVDTGLLLSTDSTLAPWLALGWTTGWRSR